MFEKIKDIFYDLNDLLVTLIIILVIVLAIAYVFTNAFDLDINRASVFDFFGNGNDAPAVETDQATKEPATTEPATAEPATTETGIVSVDPQTDEPAADDEETAEPEAQNVTLTMEPGLTLQDFAQLLQQNGVIKDYSTFVELIVSQGLDTQIQARSYTFPLDITDAEAVRIMFE